MLPFASESDPPPQIPVMWVSFLISDLKGRVDDQLKKKNMVNAYESTPLNKLAVADAAWSRMPVDSLNMTLA